MKSYFSGLIKKCEIRDKYKQLIKQYHPDVYVGHKYDAIEITKEIIKEYRELMKKAEDELEFDNFLKIEEERVETVKYLAVECLNNTKTDIDLIIKQIKNEKSLTYSGCSVNKLIRDLQDISFMLADRAYQDYKQSKTKKGE